MGTNKKVALLLVLIIALGLTFYSRSDAACIDIDKETRWLNVDGTVIRVVTKNKDALVSIDIDYPRYKVRDSSKIVFKTKRMCKGDDIIIDGKTWEIEKVFSILDR